MDILNNKGVASRSFSLITVVVLFVIFLIPMIYFSTQFATAAPAAAAVSSCELALIKMQGADDFREEHQPDEPKWHEYVYKPGEGGFPIFGSTQSALYRKGKHHSIGFATDFTIEKLQKACRTVSWECIGSADQVANCLYRRSTDTYYALLANTGIDTEYNQDEIGNLFEIMVVVEGPGKVELFDGCGEYVKDTDNEKYNCNTPDALNSKEICFRESPTKEDRCEIQFTKINSYTIGLSMIEECQQKGISSSACKCFVLPRKGFDRSNGLPLGEQIPVYFSGADSVFKDFGEFPHNYHDEEAIPDDEIDKFQGCGWDSPHTDDDGYVMLMSPIKRDKKVLIRRNEVAGFDDLGLRVGSTAFFYTSLRKDDDKQIVSISSTS